MICIFPPLILSSGILILFVGIVLINFTLLFNLMVYTYIKRNLRLIICLNRRPWLKVLWETQCLHNMIYGLSV